MSAPLTGKHTLQEIRSQPWVWEQSLQKLSGLDRKKFPQFSNYDQILFTGCGSTYYLSLWAARLCENETGAVCRAAPASDLILHPRAWLAPERRSLLVAISRSAETTETIRALGAFQAGQHGDAVVVTCYPERRLAQLTPWVVPVPDSQEESVAQTRSFTSMMLGVLWLVIGTVPATLPGQFAQAGKALLDQYAPLAKQIGTHPKLSKFFFLGSGALYGLACEAMLKMKEMSMAQSEAFHVLEFRHGPMSIVDADSLVIGLMDGAHRQSEMDVLKEMRLKGARTLGLGDLETSDAQDTFSDRILFPDIHPRPWRAPLYLPILQLIAYEKAIAKNLDPDHPTNLSSVVVLHE